MADRREMVRGEALAGVVTVPGTVQDNRLGKWPLALRRCGVPCWSNKLLAEPYHPTCA